MDPIGFALSVYPAVVLALQELKTGYRHCQNWARYRQRFESRINDLAFHRIAFQELIFILLCSGHDPYLAQTDEAGDDFVELVRCDKSPQLKRHLEMRLGNKYDPFMYKVSRICELLEWLSKDLEEINKVSASDRSPDWWRLQWAKIKDAFTEEYEEIYKETRRLNNDLKKVLDMHDSHQALLRTDGGTNVAKFFKKVQENAKRLHKVLSSSWHCQCDAAHKALFLLEPRFNRESGFCLIFFVNGSSPVSHRELAAAQDIWGFEREVHIDILEEPSMKVLTTKPVASNASEPQNVDPTSEVEARSPQISRNLPVQEQTVKTKSSRLSAAMAKIRGRKKSTISPTVQNEPNLTIISPTISMQESSRSRPISVNSRVTFAEEISVGESEQAEPLPVTTELCMEIRGATTLSCIHDKRTRYQLYLHSPKKSESTITLKELLKGDHKKFPLQARLSVAANLASSLAQLQSTSWLSNYWGKQDIVFGKRGEIVIFDKPYIATQFLSIPIELMPSSDANESGLPDEGDLALHIRASLKSLGIVLIELCLAEVIEESSRRVPFSPPGNESNHIFRLAIASTFTEEELFQQGHEFSKSIDNCFHFPDVGRARRGRYQEVLRDIYIGIAKPLHDEILRIQQKRDIEEWRVA